MHSENFADKLKSINGDKLNEIVKGLDKPAERRACRANPTAYLKRKGLDIPTRSNITMIDYGNNSVLAGTGSADFQLCASACWIIGVTVGTEVDW